MIKDLLSELKYLVPPMDYVFRPQRKHLLPEDRQVVEELRSGIANLPTPQSHSADRPAKAWLRRRQEFRDAVARRNPLEFFRWPVIRRSMFVPERSFVRWEYDRLVSQPDWEVRWRPALQISQFGCPRRFSRLPETTSNAVHLAYHAWSFQQSTGLKINDFDEIVEIGGGYGGFCQLTYGLGFRGRYTIVDLPEISALQRFYLRANGLQAEICERPHPPYPIRLTNDPATAVPTVGRQSLVVATWSLSEIAQGERSPFENIFAAAQAGLVAFQENFRGCNNVQYFSKMWQTGERSLVEMTHLPGNFYLFFARS